METIHFRPNDQDELNWQVIKKYLERITPWEPANISNILRAALALAAENITKQNGNQKSGG